MSDDDIHCVSLCPSRCVGVVNMVAVAAVNMHIQGQCAVISQNTAGNTHPLGNLVTFMVVRATMKEIRCSILVIFNTVHYLIDTVVLSHRNIITV
jgi:hypothetical protein